MKKRQNLVLKSLGADSIKNPDSSLLAQWILNQKKVCCDLISYKIEGQVINQKGFADTACAGGVFYRQRITESLSGLKSGFLREEPYINPGLVAADAERVSGILKDVWFSFPPPSGLQVEDGYYNNRSDFIGGLCCVYKKMMRNQRDLGVKKHVLISDRFDATELDELSGERVFFFSPRGGSKVLSSILEYQNSLAVFPEKLPVVFELLNEYEIRNITVINASYEDFMSCLNHFDADNIAAGGFCQDCDSDYWKILKEKSFIIR